MKTISSASILSAFFLYCGLAIGHAQDLKTLKFITFDQSAFKNALASAKPTKAKSIHSYGVFIDNQYAGQIGDAIRLGDQKPSNVKIVARADGQSWSAITVDKPGTKKLQDLYTLKINPQHSANIHCPGVTASSCKDLNIEQIGKTAIVAFRSDAFSGKNVAMLTDFGYGPEPGDDTKDIKIQTEPAGAEVYLDNRRYWKATNVVLSVPFTKVGTVYAPHSLTLRLAKEQKSSGVVMITYGTKSITYKFETATLEVK